MASSAQTPLFSEDLISPEVASQLPEGYKIRPLRRSDYADGFLDVLRVLTAVGDVTEEVLPRLSSLALLQPFCTPKPSPALPQLRCLFSANPICHRNGTNGTAGLRPDPTPTSSSASSTRRTRSSAPAPYSLSASSSTTSGSLGISKTSLSQRISKVISWA